MADIDRQEPPAEAGHDRSPLSKVPDDERYQLRASAPEDFEPISLLVCDAFGGTPEPESLEVDRLVFEPERSTVAVRDDRIVAHAGIYSRDLTVPGASVAAAHVTNVGVRAEHRRRGLLRRLMTHQLTTVTEPIAVLWASEGRIYQRFGYGMASSSLKLDAHTNEVKLAPYAVPAAGELSDATPGDVRDELALLYEQVRLQHPGWSNRPTAWWDVLFADPKCRREGASPKRLTVYREGERIVGYALWHIHHGWRPTGPAGTVGVLDVAASTPAAYAALWRHLLSIDLTRGAVMWYAAVDEPLQYLVNEPRGLGTQLSDGLWVRLVDVPVALAIRRYATPVDAVIEVNDELLPSNAGRYHLRCGSDSQARCDRTDAPAVLSCDVAALAAAYLGGVSLTRLADAGRVSEHEQGALQRLATAFSWTRAPAPNAMF